LIADTTENLLISLYAIHKGKSGPGYTSTSEFYKTYLEKWSSQNSPYLTAFSKQVPGSSINYTLLSGVLTAGIFITIGFLLGRHRSKTTTNLGKLSIQERKILELLRQGATNQEISNQYNIEVSTVKSHVSSILLKLKVKSRKEIMNLK
jgi:DNA-binding CsgD family transcriptional regulator